ncbi:Phospholipase/Carboxylesterase-domain-containing protein, partial [Dendryphion nanum]
MYTYVRLLFATLHASTMTYPTPFIIHPSLGSQHTHTVILLHGRGSTAEEFATDLFALATTEPTHGLRDAFPSFRWVFPDAGERWCTSFKEKRSAWFDTYSLSDLGLRQDLQVEGLRSGIQWLKNIIESEVDRLGGNSENIVLGGFSQGSATALWSLFTGLSATKGKLGAFIGLSAWAPFLPEVEEVVQDRDTSLSSTDRARTLMSTAMNVLGLDAVTDAEKKDHCLQSLPIYLGHGN